MEGGILDCVAQSCWMYVVIIILAIIAGVWLTCAFSTSACESQWFGRLCRVLPWSSCGKNNVGSHPTIELNIDEVERLSLSTRQTNNVSRYVVVNADKMRETHREYKSWMSGYSSRVSIPVGECTFHPGRRWCVEVQNISPNKKLADSERKFDALFNDFLIPGI